MNPQHDSKDLLSQLNLWIPRVLIAIAVLLLVYFTQRTYRFKGLFDESFLAEENLELSRGPFAKKEFYERGEVDYQGKLPPFVEEFEEEERDLSQLETSIAPPDATRETEIEP